MTNQSKPNCPKITVVTPSLNQGEFIEETIVSVLSQAGDFFLDYVVMDGESRDNSVGILKKFDYLLKNKEWQVRCRGIDFRWHSKKDNGQSDAINQGLKCSRGEILGWLNSDDVYYPGTLQNVANLNWEKTDICYGEGMWISKEGVDLGRYPTFKPSKYAFYYQCTLCQPAVFFGRRTWQSLGNLSLEYHCVFDYEYWVRALFSGKSFTSISRLLAKSRMYPQNKSLSDRNTVDQEQKRMLQGYYDRYKMNQIKLKFYRWAVDRATCRRVKKLRSKLLIV